MQRQSFGSGLSKSNVSPNQNTNQNSQQSPNSDAEEHNYKHSQHNNHEILVSEDFESESERRLKTKENYKLIFSGFAFEFEHFLKNQPQQELAGIKQAEINLSGVEVQRINKCAPFCCGFLFTYIYCLSNSLFCCNRCGEIIYTLYEVDQLGYTNISCFLQLYPNLKELKLRVKDNNFNKIKASILQTSLKKGNVQTFELINDAIGVNFQPDRNFEDFANNCKGLKDLRVKSTIKWENKIVL